MMLGDRCMSCGACENVCPTGAIETVINEQGFYRPCIDTEKCVNCNQCTNICPELNESYAENDPRPHCYALFADLRTRWDSSSGGAFTVLAEYYIEQGGKVYGCAFDEDFVPYHRCATTIEELSGLKKSKYAQSYMGKCYQDVRKSLEEGTKVLFTGLPCQIAALMNYLGDMTDGLCTVDLICSGNTPVGVWKKYIRDMEDVYGKISDIDFRPKKFGWKAGDVSYELACGREIDNCPDVFMIAFLQGIFRDEACAECKYAGFPRRADITIGDCWGIAREHPEYDDRKGTSLLIANSDKGSKVFNAIKERFVLCEEIDFDFTISSNMFMKNRPIHKGKDIFFMNFNKGRSVVESIARARGEHFDVGIVGAWSCRNYGAHLTQYALYRYLEDKGNDVLMIDLGDAASLFRINPYSDRSISKTYGDLLSMKELNDKCDTFVVGSDQLWNWRCFHEGVFCYTLPFVDSGKRKISYATSFGEFEVEMFEEEKRYMKYMLGRFQAISVREDYAVDTCGNEFGLAATQVLDPVFLLDKEIYQNMIDKSNIEVETGYIFCYLIWPEEKVIEALKGITDRTGLRVVYVGDASRAGRFKWDIILEDDIYVEDWLKLLSKSEMVVTNSFHAYAFSTIFEKKVLCTSDNRLVLERMCSFANAVGLEKPMMADRLAFWPVDEILKYIERDYPAINKRISHERKKSSDWLDEAMKTEVIVGSGDKLYDAFGLEYIQNKINNKRKDVESYINSLEQFKGKTVVYGLGLCFNGVFDHICSLVNVDYVCDRDHNKWGKLFSDRKIKCLSPEELKTLGDPYIIIAMWNHAITEEVYKQLTDMGLKHVIRLRDFWASCEVA